MGDEKEKAKRKIYDTFEKQLFDLQVQALKDERKWDRQKVLWAMLSPLEVRASAKAGRLLNSRTAIDRAAIRANLTKSDLVLYNSIVGVLGLLSEEEQKAINSKSLF